VGVHFGNGQDRPAPGDYDGDGKIDVAVFRPSDGTWYIRKLIHAGDGGRPFWQRQRRDRAGDYDGDGKTDIAVFRPSDGTWYIRNSSTWPRWHPNTGNGLDRPNFPPITTAMAKPTWPCSGPSDGPWYLRYSTTGTTVGVHWGQRERRACLVTTTATEDRYRRLPSSDGTCTSGTRRR